MVWKKSNYLLIIILFTKTANYILKNGNILFLFFYLIVDFILANALKKHPMARVL